MLYRNVGNPLQPAPRTRPRRTKASSTQRRKPETSRCIYNSRNKVRLTTLRSNADVKGFKLCRKIVAVSKMYCTMSNKIRFESS